MSARSKRIYTRKGDDGKTNFSSGERLSKSSPIIDLYGDLDELVAVLGLVRAAVREENERVSEVILTLENLLLDLGVTLRRLGEGGNPKDAAFFCRKVVEYLERVADDFVRDIPELEGFVIPGDSRDSAFLHLARSVCRRAERNLVRLLESNDAIGGSGAISVLNRMSDLLFVMARWSVHDGRSRETLWRTNGSLPEI